MTTSPSFRNRPRAGAVVKSVLMLSKALNLGSVGTIGTSFRKHSFSGSATVENLGTNFL